MARKCDKKTYTNGQKTCPNGQKGRPQRTKRKTLFCPLGHFLSVEELFWHFSLGEKSARKVKGVAEILVGTQGTKNENRNLLLESTYLPTYPLCKYMLVLNSVFSVPWFLFHLFLHRGISRFFHPEKTKSQRKKRIYLPT